MNKLSPFTAVLLVGALAAQATAADSKPTFNRDIRPILAENCFACHGPDKAARKADLRLDIREEAIKGGAIEPGNVEKSPLVERVFSTSGGDIMPPPKSHKKLTAAQKDTLKRWIAAGAEYEAHWSFIPPKRHELPAVKNTAWVRNSLDRFVLAGLEKKGLSPAPEADRRTLARRVALDVTGLPPKAADVEAFVNDRSPDAYERYVDKMLASPFWGEHRGRYWLDAARYADTHGIHFDNFREMWSYREWVIKAFNRNQPFDQFTIDQLAGDLLPEPTMDQVVASGFNRCNITTNEGGAINEEYLVLYTRDRTETTSQVWLGLTTGCAVCHDHKFDPISQREFYQLSAFFNNTSQAAMDGNIPNTPPTVMVPRSQDKARWDELSKLLAAGRVKVDQRRITAKAGYDKWVKDGMKPGFSVGLPEKLQLHLALNEGKENKVTALVDGKQQVIGLPGKQGWGDGHISEKAFRTRADATVAIAEAGDFEKDQGFSFGAWVRLPRTRFNGAIFSRMNETESFRGWDLWVEGGRIGTHIINKFPEDAIKVMAGNPIAPNVWTHVFVTYDGSGKAAGVKVYVNGQEQAARNIQADSLKSTIRTKVPWKLATRNNSSRLDDVHVQDVWIFGKNLSATEVTKIAKAGRANYIASLPQRTPEQDGELFDWYLTVADKGYQDAVAAIQTLQREEQVLRARGTVAHVMNERREKPMAHILFRGEYDKRRDAVTPATPAILPKMSDKLSRDRLGFAKWLLEPGHPLTGRVTVNRFWQEVFGEGIVRTSGDFGITGDQPSHPELLDYLALEFSENGWDVKRFFKMMLMSATYRQSPVTTAEKREKDRDNILYSRGPRFRMDAEVIRDYALAASDLLVPRFGGPSVKPYQPEGVWEAVAMIGSNTRDYRADSGENLYRRSLYTFWKRSAPPASLDLFNAPNRETCSVKRERTNTPLQALVTLNDPQFVEAARVLAEKAVKSASKTDDRLDYITLRLLSRKLRPEERKVIHGVLTDILEEYLENPAEAKKLLAVGDSKADATLDPRMLAAWTMVTNSLLNLDEVLCK